MHALHYIVVTVTLFGQGPLVFEGTYDYPNQRECGMAIQEFALRLEMRAGDTIAAHCQRRKRDGDARRQ